MPRLCSLPASLESVSTYKLDMLIVSGVALEKPVNRRPRQFIKAQKLFDIHWLYLLFLYPSVFLPHLSMKAIISILS